jgi:hypothetical protein
MIAYQMNRVVMFSMPITVSEALAIHALLTFDFVQLSEDFLNMPPVPTSPAAASGCATWTTG